MVSSATATRMLLLLGRRKGVLELAAPLRVSLPLRQQLSPPPPNHRSSNNNVQPSVCWCFEFQSSRWPLDYPDLYVRSGGYTTVPQLRLGWPLNKGVSWVVPHRLSIHESVTRQTIAISELARKWPNSSCCIRSCPLSEAMPLLHGCVTDTTARCVHRLCVAIRLCICRMLRLRLRADR